ncbi:MAG TPA: YihY/virulence factor BrkB family protein [Bryobacteraceae bacterium]|nr:YihY/virulence factor BrkB family protein [Bryobacteraceae bacterium]
MWPIRICGEDLRVIPSRVLKRFVDVRVTGLAAELTYYLLLSLFPLTGLIGAGLGFLERFVGPKVAQQAQLSIISGLQVVFSWEATNEVIVPLAEGLLGRERAGLAVGSFLISIILASRIFRSVIDTLDVAYRVRERRSTISLWGLSIVFTFCATVVATLILSMVVVGPFLGGGKAIADWLGFGAAFETAWTFLRWPAVFATSTAFLAFLYRMGPNARTSWWECLPGAVLGMVSLVLVAISFRFYIEIMGLQSPTIENAEVAVSLAVRVIATMMATLLWVWLSSMVVLAGGVVNAELNRIRRVPRV